MSNSIDMSEITYEITEEKNLVEAKTLNTLLGNIDIDTYVKENAVTQYIPNLEQSYIDDLGNPNNVNGQPYDSENNTYILNRSYLSWMYFDSSFTTHYDLYITIYMIESIQVSGEVL